MLFDVTFVAAFAQASDQAAHFIAEAHFTSAATGFVFVTFAVCWAWVNFSWFASAFDTDDWFFRLMTMVQMVGVLILALGTPPVFESINAGEPLDIGVLVAGYVVMRVAMLAQWLRVARQDPGSRRTALVFATTIAVAQIGGLLLRCCTCRSACSHRFWLCCTRSNSEVRCSPQRCPASRHGMRTTSPSGTDCS